MLEKEQVECILESVFSSFYVEKDAEITLECNPESISDDKMKGYKKSGINRISIGVQSLDNEILKIIGRIHDREEVFNKFKIVEKYFDNISEITPEQLIGNGIEGIILDLDNTIIDKKGIEVPNFDIWKDKILESGIKIVVVTNNFLKKRIEKITNKYNLEYILFARKPNTKALVKAKEIMGIEKNENVAVIGDQVFTDVLRRK